MVLSTPLDIYNKVIDLYPRLNGNVEISPNGESLLELRVDEEIPSIQVRNEIDWSVFLQDLQFYCIGYREFINNRRPAEPILGTRFLGQQPLTNGWKFNRFFFEKGGGNCSQVLYEFLNGTTSVRPLEDFGLAPHQLTSPCKEDVYEYFKECFLSHFPLPQAVLSQFERHYPSILDKIQKEYRQKMVSRALTDFLEEKPGAMDLLQELCIDPNQVISEEDYQHFRDFFSRNPSRSQHQKELFSRHYPAILSRIVRDESEQATRNYQEREQNFYANSLRTLQEKVLGQDYAVRKMVDVLARQRNNPTSEVFLFVGPTGVGKTELAKQIGIVLANQLGSQNQDRCILLPMNQFGTEHDIYRFFGVPVGFSGSSDKPVLAKEFERGLRGETVENLVVLFDEIEKAHNDLKQSLLTLFDEKKYIFQFTQRDPRTQEGRNVSYTYGFKNCFFICTSNLCQEAIMEVYLRRENISEIEEKFKIWNRSLPSTNRGPQGFSQEFLGRMSHIIPFGPVPRGACYQKLLEIKFGAFFQELKRTICREVDVEDKALFYSTIEGLIYERGVDIRRVGKFLTDIKGVLCEREHSLGGFRNKKILFCISQGRPHARIFFYSETMGVYTEVGEIRLVG